MPKKEPVKTKESAKSPTEPVSESSVSPPAEPPTKAEETKKMQELPKQQVEGKAIAPPPRKSFFETIDPWVILLIILLLIGLILLTLVIKFISTRKKTVFEVKAPAQVNVKNPVKSLKISTPIEGTSLKDAPVIGDYRIIGKIASGGMANIYKATHIKKGGVFALKVPYEQFQNDKKFVERFHREAELGKKLHNENIVRIYESGNAKDGFTYIAMEYLGGIDLRQYRCSFGIDKVKGSQHGNGKQDSEKFH